MNGIMKHVFFGVTFNLLKVVSERVFWHAAEVLPCVSVKYFIVWTCPQLLSHVQLFETPWTTARHRILKARILQWAVISPSRVSSWTRDWNSTVLVLSVDMCVFWLDCSAQWSSHVISGYECMHSYWGLQVILLQTSKAVILIYIPTSSAEATVSPR